MSQPNIIVMISHDTGRYLGCYGHHVQTPHIDRLAFKGIRFEQYFCPAPQCSPSRGSILTGRYPHNNGLIGLAHLGFHINGEITTIPKEFQKAGYETSLIGLSHETIGESAPIEERVFSSTYKLGYDRFIEVEGDRAPKVADQAIDFLQEKSADSNQPFYLNIGFFETHREFDEYEPYADKTTEVSVLPYLPDTPNTRKDLSQMNGSVKVLDKAIGRILHTLNETGLQDNTIVVYTTDHGIAFPRAKGTFKEAGLETALIIYHPEYIQEGKTNSDLLCNIDLMPTILELAGIAIPEDLDGKSFAKVFSEDDAKIRDEFFCELTWHDRYHPMRGIRTDRYKYVKNFENGPKIYMPLDAHKSLSGQEVREEYYVPNELEELYDLEQDPLEQSNLIADEKYKEIAIELRQKVQRWMEETNDPLLNGPVPGTGSKRWEEEIKAGRAH
ncbi:MULTISPECIES: sulfatase family protein [Bacillus]|uniref:Sulfatase n=2 Tax=Bacillus TaxID=1386 RepID=A0A0M4FZD4_9BACI|nr:MULTISPECIES: sulfatase [Bacillus]ALC82913.1 sulfatase [Bacillus gobiensis]MBP1081893.1 arylsulfatase A-like enzyme [Bacillus capparidis]MED1096540.1 sulfatase [Bacillus capparidis]